MQTNVEFSSSFHLWEQTLRFQRDNKPYFLLMSNSLAGQAKADGESRTDKHSHSRRHSSLFILLRAIWAQLCMWTMADTVLIAK